MHVLKTKIFFLLGHYVEVFKKWRRCNFYSFQTAFNLDVTSENKCFIYHLFHTDYRLETTIARAGVSKCGARFETLFRGPTQWCIEILERVHQGVMVEIGDVMNARP